MFSLVLMLACARDTPRPDDSAAPPVDDTGVTTDGGGGVVDTGPGPDDTATPQGTLAVQAVQGELAGAVWLTGRTEVTLDQVVIQAQHDGAWADACTGAERCLVLAGASAIRAVSVDGTVTSAEVTPTPVSVVLQAHREDQGWWADERVELDRSPSPEVDGIQIRLSRQDETGEAAWWSPDAAWTASPQDLGDGTSLLPQPSATGPLRLTYTLSAALETASFDLQPGLPAADSLALASASVQVVELGRRVLWGDPHLHTDLSYDGCEFPEAGCQGADNTPAGDVFDRSHEAGLDWAAITDHAEWNLYQGSPSGPVLDIWQRAQQVVAEAEGTGIIPVLGYEWTYYDAALDEDGYRLGGHRTILLEGTTACDEWRVAGNGPRVSWDKGWGTTQITGRNTRLADAVAELRSDLETASADCGAQRVLIIGHHPALRRPQPIDWAAPFNVPDPSYQPVVEIASEHGTSECADLDLPWCDWRVPTSDAYFPGGSFQTALELGYHLGVVGGTDAHDGLGLASDGPSCTALALDETDLGCQNYNGAATGVLTASPYDRSALFDGLIARSTIATSGPLVPVRAWATVEDDPQVYLPGAELPAGSTGAVITASLLGAFDEDAYTAVAIDLLDAWGETLATTDEPFLQVPVNAEEGDAFYVRVRLYGADDLGPTGPTAGEGERLWLSPWFF